MAKVRRVIKRAKPSATWPGLSKRVSDVFSAVLRGQIPANLNDITIRREKFFHRLLVPAAGTTNLTFFNAPMADFVTNLPQPGQLPAENAFALGRVNVSVETGMLTTGLVDTAGEQIHVQASGTTNAAAVMVEQIRQNLVAGQLKLKLGDKQVINQKDLTNFPAGHSFYLGSQSQAGGYTAGNNIASLPFQNGGPLDTPWLFRPWYPVLPGKQITANMIWQGALAVTSAVTYLVLELEGILVTPSNL